MKTVNTLKRNFVAPAPVGHELNSLKDEQQAFDSMVLLCDEFRNRLLKHKENRDKMGFDVKLPHYLLLACKGGGVSTSTKALADYLYHAKLLDFAGIERCFEFKLAYTLPNSPFFEIIRFHNSLADITGYHRHFRGVVCIDITEWERRSDEPHFSKFLECINKMSDRILVVFYVNNTDDKTVQLIETALSAFVRFETIPLRFPNTNELIEIIETRYLKHKNPNFKLENDAKKLLKEAIDEIKQTKSFNGFSTIKNLASDILNDIYASDTVSNKIYAKNLPSVNLKYVQRFRDKRTTIGYNNK